MISTVKPTPVTLGGAQWPVLFTFGAWMALCEVYGTIEDAMQALASEAPEATTEFLRAGLLHDCPDLTAEQTVALMDGATLPELLALPAQLVEAIRSAQPDGHGSGSGDPWDWDMAWAVWTTEWHQNPAHFRLLTFRDFARLSDGRSRLYQCARGEDDSEPVDVDPFELIRTQRRGR